ncbi:MAG: nuclear transport factor 2 family protein [Byssovorax sp.]
MPPDDSEILAANQAFYDAFTRSDLETIEDLWASFTPVACIHPGWDALHGREDVLESFRAILGSGGAPRVTCVDPAATRIGDAAFVVCHEAIDDTQLVATNVFVREDGRWKLVHHQAGPMSSQRPRPRPRPAPNRGLLN